MFPGYPEKIDAKYLERFPSFVNFETASASQDEDDVPVAAPGTTDLTPDDQLEEAFKQINESLASDLLNEALKKYL